MMEFDANLFLAVNRALSGPVATEFFSLITYLGNGLVLALAVLPALFFWDRKGFKKHVLAMVLSAAFSGLLVTAMKTAVGRERPPAYFETAEVAIHVPGAIPVDRSFPSGHTQVAFAIAAYLSCMYRPFTPLFLTAAGAVGLSRIALGVHFPLDVLAGAILGAGFSPVGYFLALKRQNLAHREAGD